MNKINSYLIFLLLLSFSRFLSSQNLISYSDPVNGGKNVNTGASVIFTLNSDNGSNSVFKTGVITVNGTISGEHKFSLIKSGKVYIVKPCKEFSLGETITVKINGLVNNFPKKTTSEIIVFSIRNYPQNQEPLLGLKNELTDDQYYSLIKFENGQNDFHPDAYPVITVNYSNNPSVGKVLMSNIVFNTIIPNTPHLLLLNNDASPVFFRQMAGQIFNFDRQPDGKFTYFNRAGGKYYELDTNFLLIDSFYTGNGYFTDIHELRVLPNRHALLLSYDKLQINMSILVSGGDTAALVTGLIIQEIDENKNVVFQWRSWDHIPITDAEHQDLTAHEIDYIHGNALDLDNDGNILLSSRHLDEITKINRSTGNIIWRMGGGKKNQFSFPNDPAKFNYQHGIRRLQNGNVILFDNGNFHSPPGSRAIEYSLDETNKIAVKVWEYKNSPVIFGSAMGFAQRLPGGNTLISWGSTNPTFTEVKPDGSKVLQMSFNTGIFSYRVFKYDLNGSVTSVHNENNTIPKVFDLYQNYPNPFNPSTVLKFDLPQNSFTVVELFDILGRKIRSLLCKELNKGTYKLNLDMNEFTSGIYFCRLNAGSFSKSVKLVLIK